MEHTDADRAEPITVFLADDNLIVREGVRALIQRHRDLAAGIGAAGARCSMIVCSAQSASELGQGASRLRSGRLLRAIRGRRARLTTSRWVCRVNDPGPKRPHATKAAMAR